MAKVSKTASFRFTAPLERMNAEMAFMYVEVPIDVHEVFGSKGRVRVKGMVNGVPVDRALMPTKSGCHIIILGGDIRKAAKLKKAGDQVSVEFWPHPDPDKVDVPEELAETMDFFPDLKAAWKKVTPGMQRSICYWIGSAKTMETRAKRVGEVMRRFETGHPWFNKRRKPEKP